MFFKENQSLIRPCSSMSWFLVWLKAHSVGMKEEDESLENLRAELEDLRVEISKLKRENIAHLNQLSNSTKNAFSQLSFNVIA